MKLAASIVALALVALSVGAVALQDPAEHAAAAPSEGHAWLQQLVGEWEVKSEMTTGPGTEPMRGEGKESVRSIGGFWVLGELHGEWPGMTMTAFMTLGYDDAKKAYVGTWIDSEQPHMWSYVGTLDEARKVLTLDTQGPSFTDPSQMSNYRDSIEIVGPDHKVLTSSTEMPDGSWMTFMKADYRRKR